MKTLLLSLTAPLLGAILVLSGCASTEKRIEENPEMFMNLSPEQQQQVQSGRVDSGYTKDMVYLAKGEPSQKAQFRESGKVIEVWTYRQPVAAPAAGAASQPMGFAGAYNFPQFGPGAPQSTPMFYGSGIFRVEFEDGKVRKLLGDQ